MAGILILLVCINQNISSPACVQGALALYDYGHYDRITNKIMKKYIGPLPNEFKEAAAAGATIYKKQIKIPITKNVSTVYQLNSDNTSNTTLNLNWSFP